jgi:hypothetical protein
MAACMQPCMAVMHMMTMMAARILGYYDRRRWLVIVLVLLPTTIRQPVGLVSSAVLVGLAGDEKPTTTQATQTSDRLWTATSACITS